MTDTALREGACACTCAEALGVEAVLLLPGVSAGIGVSAGLGVSAGAGEGGTDSVSVWGCCMCGFPQIEQKSET